MRLHLTRLTAARPGRRLLILIGTGSLGLGVLGIVMPVLPTTPFLLLAAACYARSSDRLYNWLVGNRWFGEHVRSYREGRGIPARAKAVALVLLWATIGCSIAFVAPNLAVKVVLAVIAAGVTALILVYRPRRQAREGSHLEETR